MNDSDYFKAKYLKYKKRYLIGGRCSTKFKRESC